MTLRDIRPPEDVPAMLEGLARGETAMHRARHRRRDGSTVIAEISAHEFVLDQRPARLVVAHDITERERLLAAQRKVEARFARLSDSGIIGVTVAKSTGTFVEANDAFLRMIGYSRDDLDAGRLGWETLTAPEWRAGNIEINAQMRERGFAGPLEKEYVRKDGSLVQALVGMAFIEGGYVIAFVLDVSERKRLEHLERAARELEHENHRIQEANRTKSEFLANMSHELRTPLNAIIGFSEMIHDGEMGEVNAAQKESLGDVLSSGRHLLQLINDILDLAKVEAGKLEFRPRKVRLERVLAEVVATLRAPLAEKGLRVREEVRGGLDAVMADEVRLKQVLYNYLSNAIKFSPPGAEIAVRAQPEGVGSFRLEVEDHGIGIRSEDLDKLFVTFQQLDSGTAKRHAGSGLGLALTRRLVEAQGGEVGVKSTYGSGSVFHAVLPRGTGGEAACLARPS
jgi:PAS domain S-box-containing protein